MNERDERRLDIHGVHIGGAGHLLGDQPGVLPLKPASDLPLQAEGQGGVHIGTSGAVGIIHIGAGPHNMEQLGLYGQRGLLRQNVGVLHNHLVFVGVRYLVGNAYPVTNLHQSCLIISTGDRASARGDALSQCGSGR